MRVLVLGRNPSKRNIDPNIPFQGAPCWKRLSKWLNYLSLPGRAFLLANCSPFTDAKFDNVAVNTYAIGLRNRCVKEGIDRVIALGNDATKVCVRAGVKYFKMPHPSGLNRPINNRAKLLEALVAVEVWLSK